MAKPTFRLRKATTEDFQEFYNFHVHHCYQWLFNQEVATEEDNPFDVTFEDNYFFSKETQKKFHHELVGFNINDFENHLKWYRIFMIIVDEKVVGYVKLETYCKQFIVRDWRMHYNYMDSTLLKNLLKEFEKLAPKKSSVIQVISMGYSLAKEFLEENGYYAHTIPFFEKNCIKNPE